MENEKETASDSISTATAKEEEEENADDKRPKENSDNTEKTTTTTTTTAAEGPGTPAEETSTPVSPSPPSAPPPPPLQPAEQIYHIKWTDDGKTRMPIVTQNENGPCPLVAVMNVLLLRGQVRLGDDVAIVTGQELMERLGDCILRLTPQHLPEALQVDYEHNVSDAVAVLSKLMTGIDVNVKFTGISDFEYTRECIVFDLLCIPLYHGWLVDPETDPDSALAVGALSYNQLVEKIIEQKGSAQASVAENFLAETASQLTYRGLAELKRSLRDAELAVLFRNNHFSTMLKHKEELVVLVTDQGFLEESRLIWETLSSVDGDSCFLDASFRPATPSPPTTTHPNTQINNDYMMAMALERGESGQSPESVSPVSPSQDASDAMLALQLQREEERLAREEAQRSAAVDRERAAVGAPRPVQHHTQRIQQHQQPSEDKSKCSML